MFQLPTLQDLWVVSSWLLASPLQLGSDTFFDSVLSNSKMSARKRNARSIAGDAG